MDTTLAKNIKSWATEDRPREKLLLKGIDSLTTAELIAILIGSGNRKESAVDLSRRILQSFQQDLREIAKVNIKDLTAFNGIGEAKAISILAALELGRRIQGAGVKDKPQVTCSNDAYQYLKHRLEDLTYEEFWVLLLNRNNRITKAEKISKGGVAGTVVDAKIIFKHALEELSSAIILCHNHPSGNLKPSREDLRITKKLQEAGKVLDIKVLDHIIISQHGYYSFMDEGDM
jgi:DNA repair protein RadC